MNFSAAQFHNTSIPQTIVQALAEARVAPSRLEIELTQSMLISKYGPALSILNSLLQLGVTVALDDFGTGFSSLTYLLELPYTRIKIDQSFIRDMPTRPDSAAIVKSIITLAQDLHIGVVAEGVETTEQLGCLRQTSCDEVQGYLIGGRYQPTASSPCSIKISNGRHLPLETPCTDRPTMVPRDARAALALLAESMTR